MINEETVETVEEVVVESVKENMGIANLYVVSKENYKSYEEYTKDHIGQAKVVGGISYQIEGEGGESQYYENNEVKSVFTSEVTRSSSTIYGISDRTSAYNSVIKDGVEQDASPVKIVLNTIGGSKWSSPGDWIQWTVDVEESGLYFNKLSEKIGSIFLTKNAF